MTHLHVVSDHSAISRLRRPNRVAVLIPCYNEEAAIAKVVADFSTALPDAVIYVYDNNSTDNTVVAAEQAGAIVARERRQGKGHVVRRMFSDIDADIYVLVDGDDTYDAASAPKLIEKLLQDRLDMVAAQRVETAEESYRFGHRFGNAMLTSMVGYLFGRQFNDILTGYRVFSRRFVKSFPCLSRGFEIETELTVHALELRAGIAEMPTPYKERPPNSVSKLNTYRDGFKILLMIMRLLKQERPLRFFSTIAAILAATALVLAYPIVMTFLETHLVPRIPTAILATGLMILAFLSLGCGIIMDMGTLGRQEMKRLFYQSIPAPTDD